VSEQWPRKRAKYTQVAWSVLSPRLSPVLQAIVNDPSILATDVSGGS
jgi:hypothetical protein